MPTKKRPKPAPKRVASNSGSDESHERVKPKKSSQKPSSAPVKVAKKLPAPRLPLQNSQASHKRPVPSDDSDDSRGSGIHSSSDEEPSRNNFYQAPVITSSSSAGSSSDGEGK